MKKLISLLLAALLIFSCASIAFAAESENGKTPVIVVSGMGAFPTVNNETGENVFPPSAETIIKTVLGAAPSLAASAAFNKWDLLGKYGAKPIHDLFEGMKCDENGNPVYNTSAKTFPGSAAQYDELKGGESLEVSVLRACADKIGWENTYYFYYDWRMSALDIADDLEKTIDRAMSETKSKKVSLFAMSFGGTITSAYLYKYGSDKLKNVVYASSAIYGTDLVGELFSGNMEIGLDAIINYLEEFLIGSDFAYEAVGLTRDMISKYGKGAKKAVDAYLKAMLETLREPIYAKVFMDTFIRFPGVWGLMNSSCYEKAKKTMAPYGNLSESFIKKTDEYMYNVQEKTDSLIKAAEKNGTNVYIIGSYNYAGIPLTQGARNHSDCLIDTYLMTGYATVADYGKTLTTSVDSSKKTCTDKTHNHLSTDKVIDASTGILPERTWFIKNMRHVEYGYNQQASKLAAWVVTSENAVDVRSDERFPQFVDMSRKTGAFTSLTENVEIPSDSSAQSKSFFEKLDEWFGKIFELIRTYFFKAR